MDSMLIRNWNERVKEDDMVIFLGDFCFKNSSPKAGEGVNLNWKHYRNKLNGEIVFVQGNHDSNNSLPTKIKSLVFKYADKDYFCTHNPKDFNSDYSINLVGHVHENWRLKYIENTILINVGVDVWGFRPVSMDEIWKRLVVN